MDMANILITGPVRPSAPSIWTRSLNPLSVRNIPVARKHAFTLQCSPSSADSQLCASERGGTGHVSHAANTLAHDKSFINNSGCRPRQACKASARWITVTPSLAAASAPTAHPLILPPPTTSIKIYRIRSL